MHFLGGLMSNQFWESANTGKKENKGNIGSVAKDT